MSTSPWGRDMRDPWAVLSSMGPSPLGHPCDIKADLVHSGPPPSPPQSRNISARWEMFLQRHGSSKNGWAQRASESSHELFSSTDGGSDCLTALPLAGSSQWVHIGDVEQEKLGILETTNQADILAREIRRLQVRRMACKHFSGNV